MNLKEQQKYGETLKSALDQVPNYSSGKMKTFFTQIPYGLNYLPLSDHNHMGMNFSEFSSLM